VLKSSATKGKMKLNSTSETCQRIQRSQDERWRGTGLNILPHPLIAAEWQLEVGVEVEMGFAMCLAM